MSDSNQDTYLVAVEAPLPEALTYLPPETGERLWPGQSVIVPLGARKAHGVIVRPLQSGPPSPFKLKPILSASEERPILPIKYMEWLEWLSQYYIFPLGQILESVFPPLKKTGRGSRKSPLIKAVSERQIPPTLTAEQSKVVGDIQKHNDFSVHLVHGVTGSGKTEVYLQLLQKTLEKGQQGLVLVPEISLTPQLIDRFSKRFPGAIAVLHSHLTPREKTNQWYQMVEKERQILIGARSALFCPLKSLGLIILDEEHEPSYKQDEKLKYHARDAAIV